MNDTGWVNSDCELGAEARGSYSPFGFVVGLRADIYMRLDEHPGGIFSGGQDFALLDAFSTYFHETNHWWQHIGSTTGLLLSLSPVLQTHINYDHLKIVLKDIGACKPLKTLAAKPPGTFRLDIEDNLNRIVNNWYDLEFNRRILLNPKKLTDVVTNPFFDSQGHSIQVGLANFLLLLAATFDKGFMIVPHPRNWEVPAAKMREQKLEGYFFPSAVRTAPLGALQIFEGQARFNQLQYLYLTTNGKMSWDEFRSRGMLCGVYVEAFETFLRLSGCFWPTSPIAPEVLLFLLVCDLAVNPSDGYPFDLRHFESLIESADPGIRFCWFCSQIKEHHLQKAIIKCGSEQYLEVATLLCKTMACETPVGIAVELSKWVSQGKGFSNLLAEESASNYSNENLPFKICFAKHLRFAEDRIRRPEFFCWPAMFMTQRLDANVDLSESLKLFNKHQAPFLTHPNGEIRPALFEGISEKNIYETFNSFYRWILQYELVNQWIVRPGAYDLDFTWMHPQYSAQFSKPFAEQAFKDNFGVSLDDFVLYA